MQTTSKTADGAPEFYITVVRDVQWRVGEGVLEDLPKCKMAVNEAIGSWILSWVEDGEPVTAALAKEEFELYVQRGDITRD